MVIRYTGVSGAQFYGEPRESNLVYRTESISIYILYKDKTQQYNEKKNM